MLAEPPNFAAVLGEQRAQDDRVLVEGHAVRRPLSLTEQRADYRRRLTDAQRDLDAESRKLTDVNGVEFTVGQTVVALRDLFYTDATTGKLAMTILGCAGELKSIDPKKCEVLFEGRTGLHFIGRHQMRSTLRVAA